MLKAAIANEYAESFNMPLTECGGVCRCRMNAKRASKEFF
jgi:hypothetical protein